MRMEVDEDGYISLEEVYNPIMLTTYEGNVYSIDMRDNTIEITISGDRAPNPRIYRSTLQGKLEKVFVE